MFILYEEHPYQHKKNRFVLDNAIKDSNIQILQIALRTNKVIKYFNSLQKGKTKAKPKQEVK